MRPQPGVQSLPVQSVRWAGGSIGHAFPPDIAILGEADVGEDGVARAALERVGVALERGARRDAKVTALRVDGVKLAIGARLQPGDVVADGRRPSSPRKRGGGISMAKLVLPQALGKAAAT